MSESNSPYPPVGFMFRLEFNTASESSAIFFQEASGITSDFEAEEIREGGDNRYTHRIPGQTKYNNLVLKRGLASGDSELLSWINETLTSGLSQQIETKTLSVSLLDQNTKIIMNWNFINAWPVKWEISNMHTQEDEIAIESLEFAYSYFERKK